MNDLLSGCYIKLSSQGRISRLGKHSSHNGKRFIKFSVAYNIMGHVEYINFVAYDRLADQIDEYAKIGTTIYIESGVRTNKFLDKKSAKEKYISKTSYPVEALSFIANTKYMVDAKDISQQELKEYQDSVKDIDAISIAKNLLKDAGFIISKGTDNE
ncbi:single-stranded DNA-binding protein [Francisella sp. SYW-9]|uniref:single-stranded DNA-binding protein n=1 Tax=Francisella sp. SYW-9 TaxID=2610888 RepID=UPI00123CDC5C|nr:single-stranded DNA-binding protein [Francisella sp. SYW-9]